MMRRNSKAHILLGSHVSKWLNRWQASGTCSLSLVVELYNATEKLLRCLNLSCRPGCFPAQAAMDPVLVGQHHPNRMQAHFAPYLPRGLRGRLSHYCYLIAADPRDSCERPTRVTPALGPRVEMTDEVFHFWSRMFRARDALGPRHLHGLKGLLWQLLYTAT